MFLCRSQREVREKIAGAGSGPANSPGASKKLPQTLGRNEDPGIRRLGGISPNEGTSFIGLALRLKQKSAMPKLG